MLRLKKHRLIHLLAQKDCALAEETPKKMRRDLKLITLESNQVEEELEEVRVIYHSLKNMGEVLAFAQTTEIFSEALRHWSPFKRAVFALVEGSADASSLGNIYEIKASNGESQLKFELKNAAYASASEKVLKHCFRAMQPFKNSELFERSALVLPLMAQGECVGFFAVESLEEDPSFEALKKGVVIDLLVHEFALEIKKKMLYQKVKALSVTDSLTGAYLRKYFFQQMELELERSSQSGTACTLLLIDLDAFKKVNDEHGHLVGDQLLQKVGNLLKESSREVDLVGRYGGDEFVIMLPNTNSQEADKVKDRILNRCSEHVVSHSGQMIVPSLSIGKASYPEDGKTIEALIETSDKKLYGMKEQRERR